MSESEDANQEQPGADPVIEAFDRVCDQLSGFSPDVSTEWVDGYFTALVAGPRAVTPSQWLPAIFGDAFGRAFADPGAVEQAMQALMGRWNQIARELDPQGLIDDPDRLRLSPLVLVWDDESRREVVEQGLVSAEQAADELLTGAVWATGFLDAVDAFAEDWSSAKIEASERQWLDAGLLTVRALTMARAELAAFVQGHYPDQTLTRDELIDEACFAVQDLRVFWVDHAPKTAPRRVESKHGRNELCPCGSGKKYKKCHGMN